MSDTARRAARTLTAKTEKATTPIAHRHGTVSSVNLDGTIDVSQDGSDQDVPDVAVVDGYRPLLGDVVQLLTFDGDLFAAGALHIIVAGGDPTGPDVAHGGWPDTTSWTLEPTPGRP